MTTGTNKPAARSGVFIIFAQRMQMCFIGIVAAQAKFYFIVAVEEAGIVGGMDLMAGGTIIGHRFMYEFPGEFGFFMTGETDLARRFVQKLGRKSGMRRMTINAFARH